MKLSLVLLPFFISIFSFAKGRSAPPSCPLDPAGGGKKVPAQTFKLNRKQNLLICVSPDVMFDGEIKNKYLTQYDAYLVNRGKKPKKVLSGNSNTPILFERSQGQIYEIRHLNLRGSFHPLYREKIVCTKNECKRRQKTCVFNQHHLSPPSPKELEREKVIYAKGLAQVQEMTEADLAQMSTLALSGRKMAFDFFTQMNPHPILLGVTARFYEQMQDLLSQMKAQGCLQVNEK